MILIRCPSGELRDPGHDPRNSHSSSFSLADYATTIIALRIGGVEKNFPLLRFLSQRSPPRRLLLLPRSHSPCHANPGALFATLALEGLNPRHDHPASGRYRSVMRPTIKRLQSLLPLNQISRCA
jgi:hypothetical protein